MDNIVDVNTLFGPLPSASADLAVDFLLEQMQKHNVGTACTLSTLGLLLDPNTGNAATRASCAEHAELLPVATFNPTVYFGDDAPLQRLKADGFRMARFFPARQGWPVDYAPFTALIQNLNVIGLPIMVDVESPGMITALARSLGDVIAPVILAGVQAETLSEALAILRTRDNWNLETSRLLAPGAIRWAAEKLGPQRLLFGSSAPSHPVASILHTLEHSGLAADVQQQIASANARRILA